MAPGCCRRIIQRMKNMRTATPARRRPGRPRRELESDGRAALLAAARDLFLRHGYRAVSARQVSQRAGVDPALLVYHFKSKYGLYREVLQQALAPMIEQLNEAARRPSITTVVEAYMRILSANPWIAGLIVREVLSDSGNYRQQFIADFPGKLAPRIAALVQAAIEAGQLRRDLDVRLVVVSCISLSVMPFLGAPILEKSLGVEFKQRDRDALISHTLELISRGFGARS